MGTSPRGNPRPYVRGSPGQVPGAGLDGPGIPAIISTSVSTVVPSSVCHIPDLHGLVVRGRGTEVGGVVAVKYGDLTGKEVWCVREAAGVPCRSRGIAYCARTDTLLVADGENRRVLVLRPSDGSLLHGKLHVQNTRDVHVMGSTVIIVTDSEILLHPLDEYLTGETCLDMV